jgi:hypothetical protein
VYDHFHRVQFSWDLNDRNSDLSTRLYYLSGTWNTVLNGRAYRGGHDGPNPCSDCACSFITARHDGPAIQGTRTDSVSFDYGPQQSYDPVSANPFGWSDSSVSSSGYSGVYLEQIPGRLTGAFDDSHPAGAASATYYSNTSGCHIVNSSGSSDGSGNSVPCFTDCEHPFGDYMDWAEGCGYGGSQFMALLHPGDGDPVVSLHFVLSGQNAGSKWDESYLCRSITCLDTPPDLNVETTVHVSVSIYHADVSHDPPTLGALLGQSSFTGTITSSGETLNGGGVFAAPVFTCNPCSSGKYQAPCGPNGALVTVGSWWTIAKSGNLDLVVDGASLAGATVHKDVFVVIDYDSSSGNICP